MQAIVAKAQMIEHIYDFNSLPMTSHLNGVDGWTTVKNQSNPSDTTMTDWHIGYVNKWGITSLDNTLYMLYNGEGTNVGYTATRVSTTALPFNFGIGGVMELQVDIKRGYWKTFFGFGYDLNNDNILVKGVENTLSYETNEGGIGIHLSQGNSQYDVFMKPDGTYATLNINNDSLTADWFTYKMIVDLEANAGAGSISISYRQQGTSSWVSCANVSNLNLGLTPGSGNAKDPAKWTKMFIHGTGMSCIDNIIVRQPNTGGLQYQYLVFDPVNVHLTTDAPFTVNAVSNRGLPVSYSVISGPATIAGNLITLTGTAGQVFVVASQAGNATVAAAANDTLSFNVINPYNITPSIDIKNPVDTKDVNAPNLDPILLSVATKVDYSSLIHINNVYFTINSVNIPAYPTNNGYYIAYWKPPTNGSYSVTATSVSNFNVTNTQTINFNLISNLAADTFHVLNQVHFADFNGSIDTTFIFPSFAGIYSKVLAVLKYDCPPEGCEAWDTEANMYFTGANGNQIQLFAYITPYGIACHDTLDITDLVSQLQGKIDVKINFPLKSLITIDFIYSAGIPLHLFSWVDKLWAGGYPFGSITNQQPVTIATINLNDTTFGTPVKQAILRDMSHGHGWGSLNTSNAAEFYDATHHFKIDGTTAFTQHLWRTCNPSPTGCSPQSGTWQYNRSGWCPGSIPILWRFDMSNKVGTQFNLMYEFDPTYQDLCSPYNPNCVTGTTCSDCNDMYNPTVNVATELITFFDAPPIPNTLSIKETEPKLISIEVAPNPSNGDFKLLSSRMFVKPIIVQMYNMSGSIVSQFNWKGEEKELNLSTLSKGIYFLKAFNDKDIEVKKIIIK